MTAKCEWWGGERGGREAEGVFQLLNLIHIYLLHDVRIHTSHPGEEFHVNSHWTRLQLNMTSGLSHVECGHLGNFSLTLSRRVFRN